MVEALLAAAEAGLIGGAQAVGWRLDLIRDHGFSPPVLSMMLQYGEWPIEHLLRFVTYPFLHLGFVHMIIGGVILLAMGKMVGDVIGSLAVFVIFFASSIVGALIYGLIPDESGWLVGVYPAAYGLIGGFTFLLWTRARATGSSQVQAFTLIAVLMGIQLVFGLLFGTDNTWVAELFGFIAGFLACFVLVPGARRALMNRLRQR